MGGKQRNRVDELRGASQLLVKAITGVASVVEEMHQTIGGGPALLGKPMQAPTNLVTGAVYTGIRATVNLVGSGIDATLGQLSSLLTASGSTPSSESAAVVAALNGVLGDYLVESDNALAIEMSLREDQTDATRDARKLLVMVHGSCMSDRQWLREGHDHGAALARDLGYRAIYVHYNSGKHVAASGAELASALDELVSSQATDVDEIAIVSHSMGGLVARAACHAAETRALAWRQKLRAIVFLGTPHHGSPLERGGNWLEVLLGVSRYSAPLARLGRIRSAGVTDLRFGNVLDEHARGGDRFEMATDSRRPLPLPEGVACYAIAASTSPEASGGRRGDGLVPVDSALGIHASPEMTLAFAPANTSIAPGIGHRELLSNLDVYERIRSWLAAGRTSAGSG